LLGTSVREENIMERTYATVAALVGRAGTSHLGHESIETTQIYLDADLELKQRVLGKVTLLNGKSGRYRPDDKLLAFLMSL
jgi:hypothetical protein